MLNDTKKLRVIAMERIDGNILLQFSNGSSVHYHTEFLWDVRDHDGNIALPKEAAEEDDSPLGVPA